VNIARMDKERTMKRRAEWRQITVRRMGGLRLSWEDLGKIEES
jgi:hypothetical protein